MNNHRILFIVFALLFIFRLHAFAREQVHVIYLKDGSKVTGTIIEQVHNESVTIRTKDGRILIYTVDKIEKILTEFLGARSDLKDVTYHELGINLGYLTGLNVAAGFWFRPAGLRVFGIYFKEKVNSIQLNIGWRLADNSKRYHAIAAVLGSMKNINRDGYEKIEWTYVGVVYNLYYRGFFLESGLSIGQGSVSSPQFLVKIGYMYRRLSFFKSK